MPKIKEALLKKRLKAHMAILLLKLQEASPDRDEAIYLLEEYNKLMETPIDPNFTRGNIV